MHREVDFQKDVYEIIQSLKCHRIEGIVYTVLYFVLMSFTFPLPCLKLSSTLTSCEILKKL